MGRWIKNHKIDIVLGGLVPESEAVQTWVALEDGQFLRRTGNLLSSAPITTARGEDTESVTDSDAEAVFDNSCDVDFSQLAVGDAVRISAVGTIQTAPVLGPLIAVRVKAGSTQLHATAAITCPITSTVFSYQAIICVRAVGASGSVRTIVPVNSLRSSIAAHEDAELDTTKTHAVGLSAQWSAASASAEITIHAMTIERML